MLQGNMKMVIRNGGWDPRATNNGLFGSYGARAVCNAGMPHHAIIPQGGPRRALGLTIDTA